MSLSFPLSLCYSVSLSHTHKDECSSITHAPILVLLTPSLSYSLSHRLFISASPYHTRSLSHSFCHSHTLILSLTVSLVVCLTRSISYNPCPRFHSLIVSLVPPCSHHHMRSSQSADGSHGSRIWRLAGLYTIAGPRCLGHCAALSVTSSLLGVMPVQWGRLLGDATNVPAFLSYIVPPSSK